MQSKVEEYNKATETGAIASSQKLNKKKHHHKKNKKEWLIKIFQEYFEIIIIYDILYIRIIFISLIY